MLRQTVAQLLETPQIGTVELPWVPCSPPALGRELSLALLSRKAGRTPQHTGLGTWGAVRKQDSTNGGHSCSLKSPPRPPPPNVHTCPPTSTPYALLLHPAWGTGKGGRGSLGSCLLCLPGIPPILLPFELEARPLISASSHGCKVTPAPPTRDGLPRKDCTGQRCARHPSVTLPNPWGLGQGELGQPLPSLGDE